MDRQDKATISKGSTVQQWGQDGSLNIPDEPVYTNILANPDSDLSIPYLSFIHQAALRGKLILLEGESSRGRTC